MKGIIFKNNGINELGNSAPGYHYVGYNDVTLSQKDGATVSGIGGPGTPPYTKVVGYLRLDAPYTDDTTITFYELENSTNGNFTVTRIISGLYQVFTDDTNALTINKTVTFTSGVIENTGDNFTVISGQNNNYIRMEYRDSGGSYKSIGAAFVSVEIRIYD
jgi:hypothetical protein